LAFAIVLEVEFVLAFAGVRLEAGLVALAERAGGAADRVAAVFRTTGFCLTVATGRAAGACATFGVATRAGDGTSPWREKP
jgi:hypothetical protein